MRILRHRTYVSAIRGSEGSMQYQQLWVREGGVERDVLEGGRLSCAFYVSSLLVQHGMMARPHATVNGTVNAFADTNWKRIGMPEPGDVLMWTSVEYDDGPHRHLGFYLGNNEAISHSVYKRVPVRHHWTFGEEDDKPKRVVEGLYRYKWPESP